jgi:hypothetical protein
MNNGLLATTTYNGYGYGGKDMAEALIRTVPIVLTSITGLELPDTIKES